jgi:hypothetical protein
MCIANFSTTPDTSIFATGDHEKMEPDHHADPHNKTDSDAEMESDYHADWHNETDTDITSVIDSVEQMIPPDVAEGIAPTYVGGLEVCKCAICPIPLHGSQEDDVLVQVTDCGHFYHLGCIKACNQQGTTEAGLEYNDFNKCPKCREADARATRHLKMSDEERVIMLERLDKQLDAWEERLNRFYFATASWIVPVPNPGPDGPHHIEVTKAPVSPYSMLGVVRHYVRQMIDHSGESPTLSSRTLLDEEEPAPEVFQNTTTGHLTPPFPPLPAHNGQAAVQPSSFFFGNVQVTTVPAGYVPQIPVGAISTVYQFVPTNVPDADSPDSNVQVQTVPGDVGQIPVGPGSDLLHEGPTDVPDVDFVNSHPPRRDVTSEEEEDEEAEDEELFDLDEDEEMGSVEWEFN